tara:strand:+ start:955 stop:1134 length:180 start_codon:yes stop_codon:yes gene_type:complete
MSTAMRDFYNAIGALSIANVNGYVNDEQAVVRSYFDNLTEEEQDFVYACMSADVYDAIS